MSAKAPSKIAMEIAEKLMGKPLDAYTAPEWIEHYDRVATLIDEGVAPLVEAASDYNEWDNLHHEIILANALEGWATTDEEGK